MFIFSGVELKIERKATVLSDDFLHVCTTDYYLIYGIQIYWYIYIFDPKL